MFVQVLAQTARRLWLAPVEACVNVIFMSEAQATGGSVIMLYVFNAQPWW